MPPTADSNATNPAAQEHLAQLHKMSTTAGITDTDYVSVNLTAVFALLLGLASGLAFLGMLLLVIPIVGVIVSIVAIRQISDSSGTQTGKLFAWAGLVLSVGCAVGVGTIKIRYEMGIREDQAAIAGVIKTLGNHIRDGKFKEAYDLFDPQDFKSNFNERTFTQTIGPLQSDPQLGKLEVFEWNGVTPMFERFANAQYANTRIRVKVANASEGRFEVTMVKRGEKWLIAQLPTLFRTEQKPGKPSDQFEM